MILSLSSTNKVIGVCSRFCSIDQSLSTFNQLESKRSSGFPSSLRRESMWFSKWYTSKSPKSFMLLSCISYSRPLTPLFSCSLIECTYEL